MKLNRNTINRYYGIFRKVVRFEFLKLLSENSCNVEYLGYIKSEYSENRYLDLYKYSEKLILYSLLEQRPLHKKNATKSKKIDLLRALVCSRMAKFRGLNEENYQNQLIESTIRYYYDSKTLYNIINKNLNIPMSKIY